MDRPELNAAFDVLARTLPDEGALVYLRAADGGMQRVAGDVTRITGYDLDALTGSPEAWWSRVHPDDRDAALSGLEGQAEGESRAVEYRVVRPAGAESWVRDASTGLPASAGGGSMGTLVSVGLERSFRAQIAALEARIWESQRLESLGALSGSVAHDFNNLLTTILSSAQLLEAGVSLPHEARHDLGIIQGAARRGATLVRQILSFASRRESEPGPVDMNGLVAGLEPILRRRVGGAVELDVAVAEGLPATMGDAVQLEQVLLNLVVNAREATPDGGVITVRTRLERVEEPLPVEGDGRDLPPGAYVCFSVRDSGSGIPLATRERIFEPFFSTKRARGGSGLGLSTVQRIVSAQGGGIRLDSTPGLGSCFHVYLPARPMAVPSEVRAATLSEPKHGARILLLEDDPSVRALVRRLLEGDGHAVVAVTSAAEAVKTFDRARPPFELVITDVRLTDRSGPEAVTALRRRTPELAVLYLTGYGEEAARAEGVDPADELLEKPFHMSDLRAAVARARERSRATRGIIDLHGRASGTGF